MKSNLSKGLDPSWRPPSAKSSDSEPTNLERNLARLGVRGAEAFLGLPGDIGQAGLSLGNLVAKPFTNEAPFPEKVPYVPTSQDLRQVSEKYLPESITKPQSKGEERADEFVQDLVGFFTPLGVGGAIVKGGKGIVKGGSLLRSAAKSLGVNTTKWLTEDLTGSKDIGEAVKMGSIVGSMFLGGNGMKEVAKDAYKTAEATLPVGDKISSKKISDMLNKAYKHSGSGLNTPSAEFLRTNIPDLKKFINPKANTINAEDAFRLYGDLNELISEGKVPNKALHWVGKFKDTLASGLETLAPKNPEFWESFKKGKGLYNATYDIQKINGNLTSAVKSNAVPASVLGYFGGPVGKAAGTGVAFISPLKKWGTDTSKKVITNKEFQKYYKDLASAALTNNIGAMAKSAKNLQKVEDHLLPKVEGIDPDWRPQAS